MSFLNAKSLSIVSALSLISGAALLNGCGPEVPLLAITANDGADFGAISLTKSATKTFTVTNTSEQAVNLETISTAAIGLTGPYSLTGGTCATGMGMPKKTGNCTLTITFAPVDAGSFHQDVTVGYTVDKISKTTSTPIAGTGILDCSITPELAQSRQQGVSAAQTKMVQDAVAGRQAGEALTQADGQRDGYSVGYNATYNAGYNDTSFGYNAGYNVGYSEGRRQGLNSATACITGQNDGDRVGGADGFADGSYDGYHDGYTDGYPHGELDGYDDGYAAGANSCGSNFTRTKKIPQVGQNQSALTDLPTACFNQGYGATYNTTAYYNAFNAAKATNVAYQNGYSSGNASGRSAGYADGRAKGFSDGQQVGLSVGFDEGYEIAYNQCYLSAYDSSYAWEYNIGYDSTTYGYDAGYSAGYYDAYDVQYDSGYADGKYDYCTPVKVRSLLAPTNHVKRFGADQAWWTQLSNGMSVDRFVRKNQNKPSQAAELRGRSLMRNLFSPKFQTNVQNSTR